MKETCYQSYPLTENYIDLLSLNSSEVGDPNLCIVTWGESFFLKGRATLIARIRQLTP